jgi:hypothetical protein
MEIFDMWRSAMSRFRQGRVGVPTLDDLKSLGRMVSGLGEFLVEQFPVFTTTAKFSAEEAMGWFTAHRGDDPRIAKGAMLRTSGERHGWTVTQVFLDADNALVLKPDGAPLGRRVNAIELDAELQDLFGDEQLVVVE